MAQLLSQDEVDALVKGISDGEVETEQEDVRDPSEVITYDLTKQERVIRGKMPTLDVINQKFAREFRISLSNTIRRTVDLGLGSTQTTRFGDFIKTVPVPASIHIILLENLRGTALVIIDSKLVFNFIDTIFGGSGDGSSKVEGRDFTSIEERFIKRIVEKMTRDLENSWKSYVPLNVKYIRSEVNPQFALIVPPDDIVILISFDVEMEKYTGYIKVCIPYSTIEPIKEKLSAGFQRTQLEIDHVWISRVHEYLMDIAMEIKVELGKTLIKGRELLNLQAGDVIQLDKDSNDELQVMVEGIPKFRGHMGVHRGNKAIQISSSIEEIKRNE